MCDALVERVSENLPPIEYSDESNHVHWGQLKLLISELQFLHPYACKEKVTVVYAGSSPGCHLPILVDMLPASWSWQLFDPKDSAVFGDGIVNRVTKTKRGPVAPDAGLQAKYTELSAQEESLREEGRMLRERGASICVEMKAISLAEIMSRTIPVRKVLPSNVALHRVALTESLAEKIAAENEDSLLLFISDIRTSPCAEGVSMDMNKQRKITLALMPHQASLKFKLDYKGEPAAEYLDGDLMLQAYSRGWSHETRLFTRTGKDISKTKTYTCADYHNSMCHHQQRVRGSYHEVPTAMPHHTHLLRRKVAIHSSFDSALFQSVMFKYGLTLDDMDTLIGRLDSLCI